MIKRFTWLMIGFALGLTSSWAITRRLRRMASRYVPADVRDRWTTNVKAAVSEGRGVMRAREDEWRNGFAPNGGK